MYKFGWDTYKNRCTKLSEKSSVPDIMNGRMENTKLRPIGLWLNQVKLLQWLVKLFGHQTQRRVSCKMKKQVNKLKRTYK